jgi:hypothetical protein
VVGTVVFVGTKNECDEHLKKFENSPPAREEQNLIENNRIVC